VLAFAAATVEPTPQTFCDELAARLGGWSSSSSENNDNNIRDNNKTMYIPLTCRTLLEQQQQEQQALAASAAARDNTTTDPFVGMRPGAAAAARSHRSKGQEYHAQVQRRFISGLAGRRFSKLEDKSY